MIPGHHFYDRSSTFSPWLWAVTALGLVVALVVMTIATIEDPDAPDIVIFGGYAAIAAAIGLPLAVFGRMRVVVTSQCLFVIWGILNWPAMRFPLSDVKRFRVVEFSPLGDFGGWGWRFGKGGARCYVMRGNAGVELIINDRSYIIGADNPENLAHAIEMVSGTEAEPAGQWKPQET